MTILIILLVGWLWDWAGALVFTAYGVVYALAALPRHIHWAAADIVCSFVIAALFLVNWIKRDQMRSAH